MSRKDFSRFAATLNTDESLRKALRERMGDTGGEMPVREVIAFAGEHGYTFSVEDASNELSDAELKNVAGGIVRSPRVFDSSNLEYKLYLKEGDLSTFYVDRSLW